jgi:hypothetical protein
MLVGDVIAASRVLEMNRTNEEIARVGGTLEKLRTPSKA